MKQTCLWRDAGVGVSSCGRPQLSSGKRPWPSVFKSHWSTVVGGERATSGQTQPLWQSPLFWLGQSKEGGHTGRGCHRAGRECAEQVRSVRVLTRAAWRRPSSSPAPGSPRRPPTHPALPNHQFRQNSRSFLNSRCRLHGRPYGLTQGFANSTVSMQSGKWWGGWPSLAGCSAAHACPRVYM